jgi:hypothetical protein
VRQKGSEESRVHGILDSHTRCSFASHGLPGHTDLVWFRYESQRSELAGGIYRNVWASGWRWGSVSWSSMPVAMVLRVQPEQATQSWPLPSNSANSCGRAIRKNGPPCRSATETKMCCPTNVEQTLTSHNCPSAQLGRQWELDEIEDAHPDPIFIFNRRSEARKEPQGQAFIEGPSLH